MKVKIFDHEHLSKQTWRTREKRANKTVSKAKGHNKFKINFDVERAEFKGIEWRGETFVPSYKKDKVNHFKHVSYEWFKENFTDKAKGYDVVICHLSSKQFECDGKHDSGGESLKKGEIIMRGSGSSWDNRFIHEECHDQCDHKLKIKDKTHDFDKLGQLKQLVRLWI